MMRKDKGFTLIELLVVIAIIGILSSVVLASLNSARAKSRDARRISDMKQLQLALELYFDSNSTYPVQTSAGTIPSALVPTYIATLPSDPSSGGTAYGYISDATGSSYCVGANLEDNAKAFDGCPTLVPGASLDYVVGP